MFKGLLQYAQIGGIHFILFFIFIISYACLRTLISFFHFFVSLKRIYLKELVAILYSVLIILVLSLVFFTLVSQSLQKINVAGIEDIVARNNDVLMKIDNKIFGVYPPFWFENNSNPSQSFFNNYSCLFTATYNSITIAIAISLIIGLTKSGAIFNKILFVYILTILIGLGSWFLFPATSPLDSYIDRKPEPLYNSEINSVMENYEPSANTVKFFNETREARSSLGEKLWNTSIPSMHIVWTVIVVYSSFLVFKPLLILSVPYLILNSIATVLTLQHYMVDILAGILLAAFVIFIVEKTNYLKKIKIFNPLSESLKKDLIKFIGLFKIF